MRVLRTTLGILALVLLGSHVLRWGGFLLALVPLLAAPLLWIRQPWAAWALRALLLGAALEWLRTAWVLHLERRALGLPSTRMVLILGAVALFTLVAAWLLKPSSPGAPHR